MPNTPKPPFLRNRRGLLKFVGIMLLLFALIYAATAATAFLRNQQKAPEPRLSDTEAPLERIG
ncbi:hypothetical protein D3C86_1592820 [compost metagenome]